MAGPLGEMVKPGPVGEGSESVRLGYIEFEVPVGQRGCVKFIFQALFLAASCLPVVCCELEKKKRLSSEKKDSIQYKMCFQEHCT